MYRSLLATIYLVMLAVISCPAQRVRWAAPIEAEVNKPFSVSLVFEDCQPNGKVILPAVDGLTFTYTGQNRQINMIQGRVTIHNSLIYTVRASKVDSFVLPSFTIDTSAGPIRVGELKLAVKQASNQSSSSIEEILAGIANAQLNTNVAEAWSGQIIPLEYRLLVNPRSRTQLGGPMVWPGTGWLCEPWSEAERAETFHAGAYWIVLSQKTSVMTDVPGERVLEPATQKLIITTGQRNTWPFPQPINEEVTVKSTERIIKIKPLPPAPDDTFTGAVGHFDMASTVTPQTVTSGEPLTWTIIISGTGNWPSNFRTPHREVPEGWRIIGPELIRESPPGRIFQASVKEEAVLIPDLPGTYTLPQVKFTYFDPEGGNYKTLASEEITITVQPSPAQLRQTVRPLHQQPDDATPSQPELPPNAAAPVITVEQSRPTVPREPLAGVAIAAAPLSHTKLLALILAPWCLLPFMLATLGIAHAVATDPARARLEARRDMLVAIAKAQNLEGHAERAACVCRWLQAARKYWNIKKAVPTPSDIDNCKLLSEQPQEIRNKWSELFTQAEDFLYGAGHSLPCFWLARAEEAARNLHPAKRPFFHGIRPEHMFPKAALSTAICAILFTSAFLVSITLAEDPSNTPDNNAIQSCEKQQADPENAYRERNWQTAEIIWRERTSAEPRDWHAHNNLALTLMQQKSWSEASAHFLTARLLAPHSDDVTWNAALSVKQLTALTPELSTWLNKKNNPYPAAFLNAATWQWVTISMSWLGAAAIFLFLCGPHFPRYKKRLLITAMVMFLIALPSSATSLLALFQWGFLADPALVVVVKETRLRSLPSEADDQIFRQARIGETAVAISRFLTWVKLKFSSGEKAWIPSKTLIPVYRPLIND